MELLWTVASLALSIALAVIARKPREVDISGWPVQAQVSGITGLFISLLLLSIITVQVGWWLPAPTIAAAAALWGLMKLLPRFVRLALEVVGIVGWPWGLVFAAYGMKRLIG